MSSSYNRNTELRNVHTKDLYKLAVILDDDNHWQILMEMIPQDINNETFGTKELEKLSSGDVYERKYSNDHIRLVENAIRRPGESRLYSQILFDEWSSSGRKYERPTLGVLLHLLVQSKLYRAADYVAELLNEPKPSRPSNGPAAEFEFDVDVFNDIQETVNDTRFYPNTEDLQDNFNIDINKDYYTKYHKNVDKNIATIDDNVMTTAPKPPPRLLKSARLLKQQRKQCTQQQEEDQLLQKTANRNIINCKNVVEYTKQQQLNTQTNDESMSLSLPSKNHMPILSALRNTAANSETIIATTTNKSMVSENVLPKLSALNNSLQSSEQENVDDSFNSTPSLIYTKSNIAVDQEHQYLDLNSIPIVVLSNYLNTDYKKGKFKSTNDADIHELPVLSALNLKGERDDLDQQLQLRHPSNKVENMPCDTLNYTVHSSASFEEFPVNDDLNIPCVVTNMNYSQLSPRSQLDAIEEYYNGIEHEYDKDIECGLDDDEDSIPNLSFLDNRSSNNESSLTSVTNTSGENSFEQSVNDWSSTSTDNVPFLSVFNQ